MENPALFLTTGIRRWFSPPQVNCSFPCMQLTYPSQCCSSREAHHSHGYGGSSPMALPSLYSTTSQVMSWQRLLPATQHCSDTAPGGQSWGTHDSFINYILQLYTTFGFFFLVFKYCQAEILQQFALFLWSWDCYSSFLGEKHALKTNKCCTGSKEPTPVKPQERHF